MLRVTDAQGAAADFVTVDIVLENLLDGVSGFTLTVEIADPGIAIIDDVIFPNYCPIFFCLNESSPAPPASTITITATDFENLIEPGADPATLVTLSVELLGVGDTEIAVLTGHEIDDDPGSQMAPELISGSISVNGP